MSKKLLPLASLILPLALAACSSGTSDPDPNGTGGMASTDDGGGAGGAMGMMDSGPPPDPNAFSSIYSDIIVRKCAGALCHQSEAGGNLILTTGGVDAAYDALVGQPAAGSECASSAMTLVVPGDPDQSLMYLKLFEDRPCGDRMPISPSSWLSDEEVGRIRGWIAAGAENN